MERTTCRDGWMVWQAQASWGLNSCSVNEHNPQEAAETPVTKSRFRSVCQENTQSGSPKKTDSALSNQVDILLMNVHGVFPVVRVTPVPV